MPDNAQDFRWNEYRLVATLFAEAIAHIRKVSARQVIADQIADFLEEHYPEFDEAAWHVTPREES